MSVCRFSSFSERNSQKKKVWFCLLALLSIDAYLFDSRYGVRCVTAMRTKAKSSANWFGKSVAFGPENLAVNVSDFGPGPGPDPELQC